MEQDDRDGAGARQDAGGRDEGLSKADEASRPDIRKQPMPTEDKVALAVLAAVVIGILLVVRWVMSALFGVAVGATSGVGFSDAFIAAIVLSIVLMLVFALFAGDGALGELPTMIIGFFLMVVFFTISIAVVL